MLGFFANKKKRNHIVQRVCFIVAQSQATKGWATLVLSIRTKKKKEKRKEHSYSVLEDQCHSATDHRQPLSSQKQ